MSSNLVEKYCVRVQCNERVGSGVLVTNDKTFFVLTAAHCLGDEIPDIQNVIIEKQLDYASDFEKIEPIKIIEYNQDHDFALIEIDFNNEPDQLEKYNLGIGILPKSDVSFCGYQNLNSDQYRPYDAKILSVSESQGKFKINLHENTFDQGGEDGIYVAEGLSGSGVFSIRFNTPFLIGILNSVITEKAWNDDIECCSVIHLKEYLQEYVNLSDFENLKKWDKTLEKQRTEREIESFKLQNTDFFNKLYRKNKVLYENEDQVNEVTAQHIRQYLAMKENIRDIETQYPHLFAELKSVVSRFTRQVKYDYSITVSTNREAKMSKIRLEDQLKLELDRLIPTHITKDLSEHQVIEWLGICTLNFENNG